LQAGFKREGDGMKVEWDKEYHKISRSTVYREELEEIGRFLKSNHKSICFTYVIEVLAKNATSRLKAITSANDIPVRFMRRKNELYVFKESE
jgi:hypothetical protein